MIDKDSKNWQYSSQIFVALLVSLCTFSTGTVLAWTSQISNDLLKGEQLGFKITEDELGWISSAMSLGAAFLSIAIGKFGDYFGRKHTFLGLIAPLELGWVLIIFAQNVWMLILGRFFTGMVAGSFCVIIPLYINEISQKEIRGSLGCFTQLMISFGILFANVVSAFVTIEVFSMICAVIPLICGVCIFFLAPESPVFLLIASKRQHAISALKKLRHKSCDLYKETELMLDDMKKNDISDFGNWKQIMRQRVIIKASIIGVGITFIKVFCGIDAVTTYLSYIFERSETGLDSKYGGMIFSVAQICATLLQVAIIEKTGRKILLIFSSTLMGICMTILAIILLLDSIDAIPSELHEFAAYVPLVALSLYTVGLSLGVGPISWMICTEIFPQELTSYACSFCTFISWILVFLNVKLFITITTQAHDYIAFFIYAAVSLLGSVFIVLFVPETKNKTYEEIQKEI